MTRHCAILRNFFVVALIARIASLLAATPSEHALTVATDHTDAVYKQGETVAFTIKLTRSNNPVTNAEVAWMISKDGVSPARSNRIKLVDGSVTLTGKLDEPGFLQCRVSCVTPEKEGLSALAAAAIDPLQITPSLPVPDDFDTYWAGEKKKLTAVPMNPRLTPQESPIKEVEVFDLQADSIGNPVSGYFARPIAAKPKILPIILTVHGAGVRSAIIGTTNWNREGFLVIGGAANWAQQGFLALDINAHGLPNGKPDQFYKDLWNGALTNYPTCGRESRDTVYLHDMFLRLVRALDFLTAQPEWDGRTVVVHGISQGGYQSIVAAGLDPRVTFFAGAVPAGCDHTGFKAGRVNGWPRFITKDEVPPTNVVEAVRYYDAVNFATRTKAAGILTVGFIDLTCPPTGVYAAYNALGGKHEIFHNISSGHANPPPAALALRKAIFDHVEAMKR